MQDKFVPKINLKANIFETKIDTFDKPFRLDNVAMTEEVSNFKDVFSGMLKGVDDTVKAPGPDNGRCYTR